MRVSGKLLILSSSSLSATDDISDVRKLEFLSGLVKDAVFLLLQIQSLPLSENPITLLRIGHVL